MFEIDINGLPTGVLGISIKSPEKLFFTGTAQALTSTNDKGEFDILPYHANFVSIVKKFIRIHQGNKPPIDIKIDRGILQAANNAIAIYLGIETTPQ